ncbi:MAG: hypothetical protein WKF79_00925 [Nocardioides sp.]
MGYHEPVTRFDFQFAPAYRLPALAFGIVRRTTWVEVAAEELRVRFGPWSLRTPLANVVDVTAAGDFGFLRTAGPAHLSFADRGITFATNGRRGVCVTFAEPVRVLDPTGQLRHPGATMTVADVDGLMRALRAGTEAHDQL